MNRFDYAANTYFYCYYSWMGDNSALCCLQVK